MRALIAAHDSGRRACRCRYQCCRCARGCRGLRYRGRRTRIRKRLRTAEDRHGVRRARGAQDLVGGGTAPTTAVVAAVRVGRRRVAAKDGVTERDSCERATSMLASSFMRVEHEDERQPTKILNTLHDYLREKVRRILLVIYLPCKEKRGKGLGRRFVTYRQDRISDTQPIPSWDPYTSHAHTEELQGRSRACWKGKLER